MAGDVDGVERQGGGQTGPDAVEELMKQILRDRSAGRGARDQDRTGVQGPVSSMRA